MSSKAGACTSAPQGRGGRGLKGLRRFALYAALQFAIFAAPAPALGALALLIIGLGSLEGMAWGAWLGRAWPALLMALGPAIAALPFDSLARGAELSLWWPLWLPGLARSARFILVLSSASWLSYGMSPVALRDALATLLKPLGARIGGGMARAASLMLAFLPWTMAELKRADEAARLRGSEPAKRPLRHLAALSVPLALRTLEKARRSAEALSLRDTGMGGGQHDEDPAFNAGSAKPVEDKLGDKTDYQ
jgi:energy-coupling factor transporter transmembrane protein EcfT